MNTLSIALLTLTLFTPSFQPAQEVSGMETENLFDYYTSNIYSMDKGEFDLLDIKYLDINNDGADEIFISNYNYEHNNIDVITTNNGKYETIASEISVSKYKNNVDYQDGFIVIEKSTGGTGSRYDFIELYTFSDNQLINVLPSLMTYSHDLEYAPSDEEQILHTKTADINGPLTNFTYTVRDESDKIIESKKFIYSTEDNTFNIVDLAQTNN